MVIGGIDPSLSNFGLAKGTYTNGAFSLSDLLLQQTAPDNKNKKQVRKNSDDLCRAKLLVEATNNFLADVDIIIAEIPVGSQSSRASVSYGVCVGILASIRRPIIQVMPNEVKLISVGSKTASKADMIKWATTAYPKANWLTKKQHGVISYVDKNEHLADAVAAIHAGIATDTFQQLLLFNRSIA